VGEFLGEIKGAHAILDSLDVLSLRRLIAVLSPQRPEFGPKPVHVRFVLDSDSGAGLSRCTYVLPYQYRSTNTAQSTLPTELLFTQRKTGDDWGHYNQSDARTEIEENQERKVISLFPFFIWLIEWKFV
jgi:hypothetical protein